MLPSGGSFLAALVVASLVVVASATSCTELCCSSDADCADSAKCFEGICARRCTHESQCREGEACLAAGVCAGPGRADSVCTFDFEPEPFDPDPLPDPEPQPDPGDGDGDGDGDGPCDTPEEPNDTAMTASPLTEGSFRVCEGTGDNDWFRVTAAAGDVIEADISFSNATGDLDLQLLGPLPGTVVLDSSQGVGDEEAVRADISSTGEHFVRVYGFAGEGGPYQLDIRVIPTTGLCPSDGFEPNDSPGQAAVVSSPPVLVQGIVCSENPDHFRMAIGPGEHSIWLENGGDQPLELGVGHVASGFSTLETLEPFESRSLLFVALQPGDLTVRVEALGGNPAQGISYAIEVQPGAAPTCLEDTYEPNDDGMLGIQPGFLALPAFINANICPTDDVDAWVLSWDSPQLLLSFDAANPGLPWFAGIFDLVAQEPVVAIAPGTSTEVDLSGFMSGSLVLVVVVEPGLGIEDEPYELTVEYFD